jgi:hypothetical protein
VGAEHRGRRRDSTKQNEQALSDTVETDEQNAKDLTGHPVVEV